MLSTFSCMTLVLAFYEDLFQLFGLKDAKKKKKQKWCNTKNTYRRNLEQSAQHGSPEPEGDGREPRSNPCYCHCADPLVLLY